MVTRIETIQKKLAEARLARNTAMTEPRMWSEEALRALIEEYLEHPKLRPVPLEDLASLTE
jgi:hypothetical protein